ncbi:JmjC domain-containing protein [Chitinophaga sancti]|uniref:JmjC domain-containing protein n=1 Tax=Chitinophaga sancti TaxID=1004 RepID=UPI003F78B2C0
MIHTLSDLLSPCSDESFLQDHFEQSVLLVNRSDTNFFHGFPLFDDVSVLLEKAVSPVAYTVVLEDDKGELSPERYIQSRSLPGHLKYKYGVDIDALFRLYTEGSANVMIRGIHQQFAGIDALQRALSDAFNCTCETQLWLSAEGAVATCPVYDTAQLFFLQLAGTRRWKIYRGPVDHPLSVQANQPFRLDELSLESECTTGPGDTLYIPAGFVYTSVAVNEQSVFVKARFTPVNYLRLVLDVLKDIGLTTAAFRKTVFMSQQDSEAQEAIEQLSAVLDDRLTFEAITDAFMRRRAAK